jgi:hypothetical protein
MHPDNHYTENQKALIEATCPHKKPIIGEPYSICNDIMYKEIKHLIAALRLTPLQDGVQKIQRKLKVVYKIDGRKVKKK